MAKRILLTDLGLELERRVRAKLRRLEPNSPELRQALIHIGLLIESQYKLNMRAHGMIDRGRLFNSARYELYTNASKVGVRVGSFGVPYAAMQEFGGPFSDRQRRAMFAALREQGRLGPNRKTIDKNVIQGDRWRARPSLMPALAKHRTRIIEILRGLVL